MKTRKGKAFMIAGMAAAFALTSVSLYQYSQVNKNKSSSDEKVGEQINPFESIVLEREISKLNPHALGDYFAEVEAQKERLDYVTNQTIQACEPHLTALGMASIYNALGDYDTAIRGCIEEQNYFCAALSAAHAGDTAVAVSYIDDFLQSGEDAFFDGVGDIYLSLDQPTIAEGWYALDEQSYGDVELFEYYAEQDDLENADLYFQRLVAEDPEMVIQSYFLENTTFMDRYYDEMVGSCLDSSQFYCIGYLNPEDIPEDDLYMALLQTQNNLYHQRSFIHYAEGNPKLQWLVDDYEDNVIERIEFYPDSVPSAFKVPYNENFLARLQSIDNEQSHDWQGSMYESYGDLERAYEQYDQGGSVGSLHALKLADLEGDTEQQGYFQDKMAHELEWGTSLDYKNRYLLESLLTSGNLDSAIDICDRANEDVQCECYEKLFFQLNVE